MLVARGKLENRQAIISVGIQPFRPESIAVEPEQTFLSIPIQSYRALIDTGAQRTCLTHRTIAAERLVRHGKKFIQNVHSEEVHSLFNTNIGVWCNGTTHDMDSISSYFALPVATEVINIADNDNFDAILGMDVLRLFDMRFEKSGHFEINVG